MDTEYFKNTDDESFWLNGEYLAISPQRLFTYSRDFPEPIPLDVVRWQTVTTSLCMSHSQWSVVLAGKLYELISEAFENCEEVIESFQKSNKSRLSEEIDQFSSWANSLIEIVDVLMKVDLSVWCVDQLGFDDAKAMFIYNENGMADQITKIPHIEQQLRVAENDLRDLIKRYRRAEATYNKWKKRPKS